MSGLGVLIFLAASAAAIGLCIWADWRDQRAHDAWMSSPDRIWNPTIPAGTTDHEQQETT